MLHVIYLVFNEGYSASSGAALTRPDLSRRGDPPRPAARRAAAGARGDGPAGADAAARVAARGAHRRRTASWCCSSEQDRALWNRAQIAEGARAGRAGARRRAAFGPYTLQAAIAAVHAEAPTAADDRLAARSSALYDVLLRAEPSPVVELNRAVGGRDARRAGGRAGADRRASSRAASSPTTTSRTPRAPICCAAWAAATEARVGLRAGADAGAPGAGAAVPRTPAARAAAGMTGRPVR